MSDSQSSPAGLAVHRVGFAAGLVAFAVLAFATPALRAVEGAGARPAYAAGVAAWMALWWLTEAVPIYATACVPIVLFPLLGVFEGGLLANLRATLAPYVDPYIFLFAGGMAIAAAMQQWDLHRRIALSIMSTIGTHPKGILGGVLAATAFVSLWISNTATATMMLPIGLALLHQLEARQGGRRLASYGMALMLAIAYGSNVGGIGTKIGTAPNMQLSGFLERSGRTITFLEFLAIGLPFVVALLPIVWLRLWLLARKDQWKGDARDVLRAERKALGRMKGGERVVLGVFLAAALLWIFGKGLTDWFAVRLTGVKVTSALVEATIAVAAALLLLLLRSDRRAVLAPRSLLAVPWETLLLLGGGFAMAAGIQQSGLSRWLSGQLTAVSDLPGLLQVLLASVVTVALSAVASNTATIAVMLVVLQDAASPEMTSAVLFAATIACSCDFALPAGTPPNAIVFGSGYVRIPTMFRVGILLDLGAAVLAALWCWFAVPLVL